MKDIDTETSVVWPSWCYSDNIHKNIFKECSEIEKDLYVEKESSEIEILKNFPSLTKIISKKQPLNSRHKNIIATISKSSSSSSLASDDNNSCYRNGKQVVNSPHKSSSLAQLRKVVGCETKKNKMLSERSLLLSGYNNNNTIDSVKKSCDQSNTSSSSPLPPATSSILAAPNQGGSITITPTSSAAAAAAYLYLEKVKNERMSPRVTAAQIDSLKDAIMESSAAAAVAAAMVNNNNSSSINNNSSSNNCSSSSAGGNCNNISNNLVISQVQSQVGSSVANNNTSDELQSHSLTQSSSHQQQQHHHHQQQQHQHQQQQSLHMNSNHVKKERLSPGTNGDIQSILSRSRSTTPSSFRGTSPQQSIHSSPSETLVPMHNLSTNLLNTIHQATTSSNRHSNINVPSTGSNNANSGLPTDFSTRNYSDFMRSLAAKYNNANPNDSSNLRRNTLFETTSNSVTASKKTLTAASKTSYSTSPSTSINKEVSITTTSSLPPPPPLTSAAISPGESVLKMTQQNKIAAAVANAAAACNSNVSPYMTSFLSSLSFSPGIFPPIIDMSSTQALITLARAAKETEIHNILSPSQHPKRSSAASVSPSPSPSLSIALQQAAQFISPALIYSAQLQKQQLQQNPHQVSRQSSPRLTNISNSTPTSITTKNTRQIGEKINASPLDLSSQPPASKRFKAESTSSQSSTDGLINTTITRRASSSTATSSPSPPPLNENSSVVVVGSSTKTEATTTAFTPIKVASSTSATSNAPAVNVRQCQAQSEEVNSWTVDDVCTFVGSIDICAEYEKHFRDQCIDGSGLPLLTEDHLVNSLGMKLGPALKLRSMLSKKLGGPCPCVACVAQVQQVLALQTGGMAVSTTASTGHLSGSIVMNTEIVGSSCNSHLSKTNTTSTNNSSINKNNSSSSSTNTTHTSSSSSNSNNSYVNNNESTTTSSSNAIATNSNNDGNAATARRNSNCNINIGNFSPPQSHKNCNSSNSNSSSNNNNNATTINCHDNADSSS